jgi:hypothetical protein
LRASGRSVVLAAFSVHVFGQWYSFYSVVQCAAISAGVPAFSAIRRTAVHGAVVGNDSSHQAACSRRPRPVSRGLASHGYAPALFDFRQTLWRKHLRGPTAPEQPPSPYGGARVGRTEQTALLGLARRRGPCMVCSDQLLSGVPSHGYLKTLTVAWYVLAVQLSHV